MFFASVQVSPFLPSISAMISFHVVLGLPLFLFFIILVIIRPISFFYVLYFPFYINVPTILTVFVQYFLTIAAFLNRFLFPSFLFLLPVFYSFVFYFTFRIHGHSFSFSVMLFIVQVLIFHVIRSLSLLFLIFLHAVILRQIYFLENLLLTQKLIIN